MPRIIIPDKICSHCGGSRWDVKDYINRAGNLKTSYYCSAKRIENEAKRRLLNHEKIKNYQTNWAKTNYEKCLLASRKSYQKNKAKRIAYAKLYCSNTSNKEKIRVQARLRTKLLTEGTLKSMLRHQFNNPLLKTADIPQDLVELKRKQLTLIRQIRNNEIQKEP
jgi:hypothetical protein